MPGQIGRVFSPQVMDALIRRGENRYAEGPRIRRTRRYHPEGSSRAEASDSARETRLNRQLELDEARARRGEDFAREKFEHEKDQDRLAWDREGRLAQAEKDKLAIQRAAQGIAQMRDANQLVKVIGSLTAAQHKTDPNTLEVPEGQPERIGALIEMAKRQLAGLLGPERAAQVLGTNPFGDGRTLPPSRAGAAPSGGFEDNPFEVGDEEADDELEELVPGIPR